MTTANWLTLIATALALAVTWGGLLVRVKMLEGRVRDLDRGREKQGARIGVVEERVAALEGAAGGELRRRLTSPRGIPAIAPEETGEHE